MKKLPITRKILNVGNSQAVTIPKSWIENAEQEAGKKVVAVNLEVNRVITIAPVFEKEETKP